MNQLREDTIPRYLESEGIAETAVPDQPVWCVAPILSFWRIRARDGRHGWLIAGDVPTDVLFEPSCSTPRAACAAFARIWRDVAAHMIAGREHPNIQIGDVEDLERQRQLGELLRSRAATFARWAEDDSYGG